MMRVAAVNLTIMEVNTKEAIVSGAQATDCTFVEGISVNVG